VDPTLDPEEMIGVGCKVEKPEEAASMRVLDELAALCGKVCDEFSPGGSTASEELCARVVLDVVTISD
jgi:hypothetical protein